MDEFAAFVLKYWVVKSKTDDPAQEVIYRY
jgi:hypothetical protein